MQPELMVYPNMMGFGGRPLVLGPTVETYVNNIRMDTFCNTSEEPVGHKILSEFSTKILSTTSQL